MQYSWGENFSPTFYLSFIATLNISLQGKGWAGIKIKLEISSKLFFLKIV